MLMALLELDRPLRRAFRRAMRAAHGGRLFEATVLLGVGTEGFPTDREPGGISPRNISVNKSWSGLTYIQVQTCLLPSHGCAVAATASGGTRMYGLRISHWSTPPPTGGDAAVVVSTAAAAARSQMVLGMKALAADMALGMITVVDYSTGAILYQNQNAQAYMGPAPPAEVMCELETREHKQQLARQRLQPPQQQPQRLSNASSSAALMAAVGLTTTAFAVGAAVPANGAEGGAQLFTTTGVTGAVAAAAAPFRVPLLLRELLRHEPGALERLQACLEAGEEFEETVQVPATLVHFTASIRNQGLVEPAPAASAATAAGPSAHRISTDGPATPRSSSTHTAATTAGGAALAGAGRALNGAAGTSMVPGGVGIGAALGPAALRLRGRQGRFSSQSDGTGPGAAGSPVAAGSGSDTRCLSSGGAGGAIGGSSPPRNGHWMRNVSSCRLQLQKQRSQGQGGSLARRAHSGACSAGGSASAGGGCNTPAGAVAAAPGSAAHALLSHASSALSQQGLTSRACSGTSRLGRMTRADDNSSSVFQGAPQMPQPATHTRTSRDSTAAAAVAETAAAAAAAGAAVPATGAGKAALLSPTRQSQQQSQLQLARQTSETPGAARASIEEPETLYGPLVSSDAHNAAVSPGAAPAQPGPVDIPMSARSPREGDRRMALQGASLPAGAASSRDGGPSSLGGLARRMSRFLARANTFVAGGAGLHRSGSGTGGGAHPRALATQISANARTPAAPLYGSGGGSAAAAAGQLVSGASSRLVGLGFGCYSNGGAPTQDDGFGVGGAPGADWDRHLEEGDEVETEVEEDAATVQSTRSTPQRAPWTATAAATAASAARTAGNLLRWQPSAGHLQLNVGSPPHGSSPGPAGDYAGQGGHPQPQLQPGAARRVVQGPKRQVTGRASTGSCGLARPSAILSHERHVPTAVGGRRSIGACPPGGSAYESAPAGPATFAGFTRSSLTLGVTSAQLMAAFGAGTHGCGAGGAHGMPMPTPSQRRYGGSSPRAPQQSILVPTRRPAPLPSAASTVPAAGFSSGLAGGEGMTMASADPDSGRAAVGGAGAAGGGGELQVAPRSNSLLQAIMSLPERSHFFSRRMDRRRLPATRGIQNSSPYTRRSLDLRAGSTGGACPPGGVSAFLSAANGNRGPSGAATSVGSAGVAASAGVAIACAILGDQRTSGGTATTNTMAGDGPSDEDSTFGAYGGGGGRGGGGGGAYGFIGLTGEMSDLEASPFALRIDSVTALKQANKARRQPPRRATSQTSLLTSECSTAAGGGGTGTGGGGGSRSIPLARSLAPSERNSPAGMAAAAAAAAIGSGGDRSSATPKLTIRTSVSNAPGGGASGAVGAGGPPSESLARARGSTGSIPNSPVPTWRSMGPGPSRLSANGTGSAGNTPRRHGVPPPEPYMGTGDNAIDAAIAAASSRAPSGCAGNVRALAGPQAPAEPALAPTAAAAAATAAATAERSPVRAASPDEATPAADEDSTESQVIDCPAGLRVVTVGVSTSTSAAAAAAAGRPRGSSHGSASGRDASRTTSTVERTSLDERAPGCDPSIRSLLVGFHALKEDVSACASACGSGSLGVQRAASPMIAACGDASGGDGGGGGGEVLAGWARRLPTPGTAGAGAGSPELASSSRPVSRVAVQTSLLSLHLKAYGSSTSSSERFRLVTGDPGGGSVSAGGRAVRMASSDGPSAPAAGPNGLPITAPAAAAAGSDEPDAARTGPLIQVIMSPFTTAGAAVAMEAGPSKLLLSPQGDDAKAIIVQPYGSSSTDLFLPTPPMSISPQRLAPFVLPRQRRHVDDVAPAPASAAALSRRADTRGQCGPAATPVGADDGYTILVTADSDAEHCDQDAPGGTSRDADARSAATAAGDTCNSTQETALCSGAGSVSPMHLRGSDSPGMPSVTSIVKAVRAALGDNTDGTGGGSSSAAAIAAASSATLPSAETVVAAAAAQGLVLRSGMPSRPDTAVSMAAAVALSQPNHGSWAALQVPPQAPPTGSGGGQPPPSQPAAAQAQAQAQARGAERSRQCPASAGSVPAGDFGQDGRRGESVMPTSDGGSDAEHVEDELDLLAYEAGAHRAAATAAAAAAVPVSADGGGDDARRHGGRRSGSTSLFGCRPPSGGGARRGLLDTRSLELPRVRAGKLSKEHGRIDEDDGAACEIAADPIMKSGSYTAGAPTRVARGAGPKVVRKQLTRQSTHDRIEKLLEAARSVNFSTCEDAYSGGAGAGGAAPGGAGTGGGAAGAAAGLGAVGAVAPAGAGAAGAAAAAAAAAAALPVWHTVHVCVCRNPVTGAPVLVVTQFDVTRQMDARAQLTVLLEREQKILESIFPRHVIEYLTLQQPAAEASGRGGRSSVPGTPAALPSASQGQGAAAANGLLALQRNGGAQLASVATAHPCVTILFADIVGFTSMSKQVSPLEVMTFLNQLYSRFDAMLDIYKVYKVETIGDCFMVAGGLVAQDEEGWRTTITHDRLHAVRVLAFAKAMLREAQKVQMPTGGPVLMRVGIHSGPVMSGVVGSRMPRFCLFGDTVNTASRMESTSKPGRIHVSEATHALLPNERWEPTGGVEVKGKGIMATYMWASDIAEEKGEQLHRVLGVYL